MITKMIMPQLSLSMRTGIVNQWYKQEGDTVEKGEAVCEIEADKAVTELEAPASGVILKIIAQEKEEFPVKEAMALIGEPGDRLEQDEPAPQPATATVSTMEQKPVTQTPAPREIKASPVARRLAKELGIDLAAVQGTGPDGLINRGDVLAASQAAAAGGEAASENRPTAPSPAQPVSTPERIKLTGVKKVASERVKASYLDAPHIELTLSIDMQAALDLRDRANQSQPEHITISDILVWATARTLINHRLVNASLEGDTILLHSSANIGLATETENGLLVPVIRGADRLRLPQIAAQRRLLTERARAGKQTPEDLAEGTFTLTNLGMYGIEQFKAIITPGQSAILAVGKVQKTPVADDQGRLFVRPMLKATLACDHRIVDGADGAKFLAELKALLEDPTALAQSL